jgi:tRNA threonylcarbamoyladenosine biosynthesis protein TsaE
MRIEPGGNGVVVRTCSHDETFLLAERLAAALSGGEVIGLRGDLGAGKTVFAQGLARGLCVCEPATSPSFVIMHQHQGRLRLCHVDLYRLGPEQVEDLGLEDLVAPDTVVAIEWSERLPARLRHLVSANIAIEFGDGESERRLTIAAAREEGEGMIESMKRALRDAEEAAPRSQPTP